VTSILVERAPVGPFAKKNVHRLKKGQEVGSEPVDQGNVVYLIQFLYGFCMLLTFNLIFTCFDFF